MSVQASRTVRRRIYAEDVPGPELWAPRTQQLLRQHNLGLVFSVRPWTLEEAPKVVKACRDNGVSVSVWPMLRDEDGRWANARNIVLFSDLVHRLMDALGPPSALPHELLVDLEPSVDPLRALLAHGAKALRHLPLREPPSGVDWQRLVQRFQTLTNDVSSLGIAVAAAVVPLCVWGEGAPQWERLLGTPVRPIPWDRVETMLYTSMLEGFSKGVLARRDAEALLQQGCDAALRLFGEKASVAFGLLGPGALGGEPIYRDASELRRDVGIALGAKVLDFSLFDLKGLWGRADMQDWLQAYATEEPVLLPPPGFRARAAVSVMDVVAGTLGRVLRVGR